MKILALSMCFSYSLAAVKRLNHDLSPQQVSRFRGTRTPGGGPQRLKHGPRDGVTGLHVPSSPDKSDEDSLYYERYKQSQTAQKAHDNKIAAEERAAVEKAAEEVQICALRDRALREAAARKRSLIKNCVTSGVCSLVSATIGVSLAAHAANLARNHDEWAVSGIFSAIFLTIALACLAGCLTVGIAGCKGHHHPGLLAGAAFGLTFLTGAGVSTAVLLDVSNTDLFASNWPGVHISGAPGLEYVIFIGVPVVILIIAGFVKLYLVKCRD